jgi:quinol monooxygenase YgiN
VSVAVAGTFRIPPQNVEALRPHLEAVIAETRSEDGCLAYSYAFDVEDAGLIRVFEHWRDQAALEAHFATPHMLAWREARDQLGFHDRRLKRFEIAGEREI